MEHHFLINVRLVYQFMALLWIVCALCALNITLRMKLKTKKTKPYLIDQINSAGFMISIFKNFNIWFGIYKEKGKGQLIKLMILNA